MKSLTIDNQSCKTTLLRAFTAPAGTRLTREEIAQGRAMCGHCPALNTCRDFAYRSGIRGFVAGTTDAERAEVLAAAAAYLTKQRAAAKARGIPFTFAERDRIHEAALRGGHLAKRLVAA